MYLDGKNQGKKLKKKARRMGLKKKRVWASSLGPHI
jgi:hypothetical protein